MPVLLFCVFVGLLFGVIGFCTWLVLYLFKKRGHGRKVVKYTAAAYLVLIPLAVFVFLPILVSHLIANASTRPQDQALTEDPSYYGRAYEPAEFRSQDGVGLRGWFLPGESSKPAIIISHGLFRNRLEVLERACRLNETGYPALVFDLRSHGKSDRRQVTLGGQERWDVLAACRYLRSERAVSDVVFAGVSMGAVASIGAAVEASPPVSALILDSPFDSLQGTIDRHVQLFLSLPAVPFSNIFLWNLQRLGDFDPATVDSETHLKRLETTPVLLIYGEDDRRMPIDVAQRLFQAVQSPRKELHLFPGADHGAAFRTDPDRYIRLTVEFLETNSLLKRTRAFE